MIVLDACAAVEIVRATPVGKGLQQMMLRNERVVTCCLYRAEVGAVLRKLRRAAQISQSEAEELMEEAIRLVDEFVPIKDLMDEAFRESLRLDHPTYDMLYFVLARRTAGTLFTLDKGLINLCADHGVNSIDLVALPCEHDVE